MQRYKIDWMAFTTSFEEHDGDKRNFDENILDVLKFDKEEFEEVPGRYFTLWRDV